MDIESGATRWKAVFPDLCCFTNLFLSKDQLIYATSDRNILCLAARDGTKVWSATVPPGSGRFPGLGNLGPDGTLYRFSYAKTLMAYKTSAGLADSEWPEPTGLGNSFATTPPKPIAPVVISIRRSELGAVLEFYGQARARYILEKCADLAASNWQSVTSVPGENAPIQLPVELDSKEQFYRLKTNRD
jgi:hypothetical protein